MAKQRLVVIGNGMAGARFVEEFAGRKGGEHFDVVMFGDEPHGNYNRILLSSVLAGSLELKDIFLNSLDWYRENGITLHAGVRVEAVDRSRRVVVAAGGIEEHYDRLVFATGSRPFVPPIEGMTNSAGQFLDGVFVFRTVDDEARIRDYSGRARKAVVLGGGLLGLEAARGLLNRGLEVHVVELMPHPMAVQLDPPAGQVLRSTLEGMGIRFHLGKSITTAFGDGKISGITLSDGSVESCDMLIVSAGIRSNVGIAKEAGLTVDRGIGVGDDLACINDPAVHAIGECAQHRGLTYGLVAPGWEQAKVLADRLSKAKPQASYGGSDTSTKLKVMGVDLVVLGDKEPRDEDEVLLCANAANGIYKKVILRGGRVAGAILLGDTGPASRLLRAFQKKEIVPANRAELLFPSASAKSAGIADEPELAAWEEVQEDSPDEPLKEVVAIIRPERWIKTKLKVDGLSTAGFTQHRVVGRGRQRGLQFLARRGATSGTGFRFLPKRMVSWIVPESQVEGLIGAIMEANRTGQIGDGKIFVLPMDGAIEIRSGEQGSGLNAGQAAESVQSVAMIS